MLSDYGCREFIMFSLFSFLNFVSPFNWINCRYQSCEPLMLSCPSCSSSFRCPAVFSSICMATSEKQSDPPVEESTKDFWRRMHCPKCPEGDAGRISPAMIANQVGHLFAWTDVILPRVNITGWLFISVKCKSFFSFRMDCYSFHDAVIAGEKASGGVYF